MDFLIHLISILLSCVIIWRASDGFEVASEYIGRNLKDGVRGATINAIGSSMPELFTTFWFLFVLHNRDGFASGIGTTAGSAIFNGMIIPAIVILAVLGYGLAKRVTVSKKVIWRDGLSLIAAEIVLIFLISGSSLDWWHGLMLMSVYGIYVFIMLTTMSSADEEIEEEIEDEVEDEDGSLLLSILTLDLESVFIRNSVNGKNAWSLLIVAMLVIGGSCALLVNACEGFAHNLGIHTYFIAVILASAATSVPDTILSYRDAMDGQYDDAVANALGSNIFDVCFALGFPLFIYTLIYGPLHMSPDTIENISEGRIKAYLLLSIYIAFTFYIASKAYGSQWALDLGELIRSWIGQ